MAQGHLVGMGGFHLYGADDKPLHPLQRGSVMRLIRDEKIELPTESEIRNMGKSNLLAKIIVLIQAGWFGINCIARASQTLSITKLELLTITYVMTHACTYFTWWDKPQTVKRPIRVSIKKVGNVPPTKRTTTKFDFILKSLVLVYSAREDHIDLRKCKQVPLCYSGHAKSEYVVISLGLAIFLAAISAGIYCIAWSYPTQSLTELVLWRLAASPLAAGLLSIIAAFSAGTCIFPLLKNEKEFEPYLQVTWFFFLLVAIFFILSRVVLLALAFMDLGALSYSAHQNVYWTTFLPHL
jgi:hypothetical protein